MIKKLVIGVTVLGALAGGLTVAAAASSARTTQVCRAVQLRPVFGGSQGAMGTLQDTWRLRNVGAAACHLAGYPAVHNYRSDGRPLPMSVTHLGTPHTVVLAPGHHASFNLRYSNPGIRGCTPEPAVRMTIQTPGAALPLIAGRGVRACHGQVQQTPLVHGG